MAQFNEWKCYWLNQKLNFGRWDSLSVCVCVCGRQRWCLSCVETRNNNRMYYRFYLRGRFCIYKMKCRQKLFIERLTILSLSLSLPPTLSIDCAIGAKFTNHELLKMSKTFQIDTNMYNSLRINSVFNCFVLWGWIRKEEEEEEVITLPLLKIIQYWHLSHFLSLSLYLSLYTSIFPTPSIRLTKQWCLKLLFVSFRTYLNGQKCVCV